MKFVKDLPRTGRTDTRTQIERLVDDLKAGPSGTWGVVLRVRTGGSTTPAYKRISSRRSYLQQQASDRRLPVQFAMRSAEGYTTLFARLAR